MAVIVYMCLIVASCITRAITGGGYTNVISNAKNVKEAADFAVMKYNEATNDTNLYRGLHIVSVEIQIVAGKNYKMILEIGRTSCQKNHASYNVLGQSCDVANSKVLQVFRCSFVVFQGLPLCNEPQCFSLQKYDCTPQYSTE